MEAQEDWKESRIRYLPNFHASNFPTQFGIQNFNVNIETCLG